MFVTGFAGTTNGLTLTNPGNAVVGAISINSSADVALAVSGNVTLSACTVGGTLAHV